MEFVYPKPKSFNPRRYYVLARRKALPYFVGLVRWFHFIVALGASPILGDYERRKLKVFNTLNFFQLLTGVLIPLTGMINNAKLPAGAWLIACLPALTSILVLFLNSIRRYNEALVCYFILYPFLTCVVYLNGMNTGIGLHFILFGILSVFFIQEIGYMLFTIAFSMVSYFILQVVLKQFAYDLGSENNLLYLLNQGLAIVFIFYGLYLIKNENAGHQSALLHKNRLLRRKNIKINHQKNLIDEKASQLQVQKAELTELNALKNRLFSVISHDLKTPMYALRNLFQNVQQYDLPADEIKTMMPDVVTDLNYTISLMENLLQWSKSQMNASTIHPSQLDVTGMIEDVLKLQRLQAESKQIHVEAKKLKNIHVFADRDMINLVLRNLLSNAIKFTPQSGKITVGVNTLGSHAEIYVQDTGMGISEDALRKINENNFYSTRGTASESGTGLGLMLCKEFLYRNGGQMHIESKEGKGSIFSFTLPLYQ